VNACAIALPETVSTTTVPVPTTVPVGAGQPRPPPPCIDVRRQAARVVATTRRHWLDDVP
jgi:hypothetical protein